MNQSPFQEKSRPFDDAAAGQALLDRVQSPPRAHREAPGRSVQVIARRDRSAGIGLRPLHRTQAGQDSEGRGSGSVPAAQPCRECARCGNPLPAPPLPSFVRPMPGMREDLERQGRRQPSALPQQHLEDLRVMRETAEALRCAGQRLAGVTRMESRPGVRRYSSRLVSLPGGFGDVIPAGNGAFRGSAVRPHPHPAPGTPSSGSGSPAAAGGGTSRSARAWG